MVDLSAISTTARLIDKRKLAQDFWGDKYDAKVEPYIKVLLTIMEVDKIRNPVEAAVFATKTLRENDKLDHMATAMLLAAALDIIELDDGASKAVEPPIPGGGGTP